MFISLELVYITCLNLIKCSDWDIRDASQANRVTGYNRSWLWDPLNK